MRGHITPVVLTLITLTAFAANSILCRLALMTRAIGPVEFTAVRIGAGIVSLLPFLVISSCRASVAKDPIPGEPHVLKLTVPRFLAPAMIFCYAIFFSLAYVRLEASVGALVLFPTVQITMLGVSILQGSRVTVLEWMGLAISFAGLVYLLWPGLSAPPLGGTVLMMLSGVSWGFYSLLGKQETRPIIATSRNFLLCLPGVIVLGVIAFMHTVRTGELRLTFDGVLLAMLSGGVASGMGYILWYLVMRRVSTTLAAVSQLVVPILAAVGGIMFLDESPSMRLAVASVLIIGGIAVMILGRSVWMGAGVSRQRG